MKNIYTMQKALSSLAKKVRPLFLFLAIIIPLPVTPFMGGTSTGSTQTGATYSPPVYGIAAGNAVQRLSSNAFATQLDGMKSLGVQWVRFDFDWAQVQRRPRNV